MVAMETMHFFIVQKSLSLRTKILCIFGVPMNDLAPMKNCPGGKGYSDHFVDYTSLICVLYILFKKLHKNLD